VGGAAAKTAAVTAMRRASVGSWANPQGSSTDPGSAVYEETDGEETIENAKSKRIE